MKEFYERTRDLPYRREPPMEHVSSFLEVYGGWHVPISYVDALPAWMRSVAWGQACGSGSCSSPRSCRPWSLSSASTASAAGAVDRAQRSVI